MDIDYDQDLPNKEELKELNLMVGQYIRITQEVEMLTSKLKKKKALHRELGQVVIPDCMDKLGLEGLSMSNGRQVSVKEKYSASLTGNFRIPAIEWLNENGYGEIINTEVRTFCGQSPDLADEIKDYIESKYNVKTISEGKLNTNTFKAVVKEALEEGKQVPLDKIGVYRFRETTVKESKK